MNEIDDIVRVLTETLRESGIEITPATARYVAGNVLASQHEARTTADEALVAAGFAKRYRLCGHPAYPDPLNIWPPTEEQAARTYKQYCSQTFDEYVAAIGHTPPGLTAEKFNPRILITWEYVGERPVFVPPIAGDIR